MPSHHPLLLLVALHESVLDLASLSVHLGAHGIRQANQAGVFPLPSRLAPRGWFVFYQPFFDQPVPRRLIDVQGKRSDAILEEAALLSTRFGESGLLLENCILKLYVCLYKLFLAVPIQKCLNTTKSEVPELFPPKNF